jgi:hypothetical protein
VSPLSRRDVLRTGGLALTVGAIAAACGENRGGATDPGRVGIAPPQPTLPAVEDPPSDVTILRTAQSMEYAALELYKSLIATGALTGDEPALFDRIVADHTEDAEAIGALITGAGGEPYPCANEFIMDRSVRPVLAAMEGSDDLHRDVFNTAYSFEMLFGASYQSFVQQLQEPELRGAVMTHGSREHRHATVLARIINPNQTFAPTFFGEPEEKDADGFVVAYAIPSVFGRVSSIELVVGPPNEEGARFDTQLQTPAQNTFVYDYMTCPAS